MKYRPKDLWIPCTFDERRPLLLDRFLYIPSNYEKHAECPFPALEDPVIFGRGASTYAEYCSGNGEWIIAKAQAFPMVNWFAVEKRFDRVRKIWSKAKNLGLNNLYVIFGDAVTFTEHYLKENSLAKIFINFPDPWPKRKHAKHRLIQRDFAKLLSRAVQPNGEAIFVTDDPPYSQEMIYAMHGSKIWQSSLNEPYFVHEWPDYGGSFFNDLWCEKGRKIHYHLFANKK